MSDYQVPRDPWDISDAEYERLSAEVRRLDEAPGWAAFAALGEAKQRLVLATEARARAKRSPAVNVDERHQQARNDAESRMARVIAGMVRTLVQWNS